MHYNLHRHPHGSSSSQAWLASRGLSGIHQNPASRALFSPHPSNNYPDCNLEEKRAGEREVEGERGRERGKEQEISREREIGRGVESKR